MSEQIEVTYRDGAESLSFALEQGPYKVAVRMEDPVMRTQSNMYVSVSMLRQMIDTLEAVKS